jgi:UDP-N-acetylmuramoylalanine--D-glutamate ligase
MTDWTGKRIIVVGAARQGLALTRYLASHNADVVLNDRRSAEDMQQAVSELQEAAKEQGWGEIEFVFGDHPLNLLDGTDLLCLSGGIPLTLPLVEEARRRGVPLSNDSQIFLEASPCPVIGITGSAGKTTTTTLVGRMAEAAVEMLGGKAFVGGNIGNPLISAANEMQPSDWAVMELSSFQLEIMDRSPDIAAVLNITPNHLDRHASMEDYTAAKRRILDFQQEKGTAVLGRDDPGAWRLAPNARGRLVSFGFSPLVEDQEGIVVEGDRIYWQDAQGRSEVLDFGKIELRGEHNQLNVMAACAISLAAGFPLRAVQQGVEGFRGVPHRLEYVRTYRGADWYNDSIATAPERAMAAIRSFDEPLVLLAGGRDKNLPWEEFASLVQQRVDYLVVFGEAAEKIEKAVASARSSSATGPEIIRCQGLEQAVGAAARAARPGSVVLLSPGGTSFDEYKDFEERGEAFRQWVARLP